MCGRYIVLSENDHSEMRAIFNEINRRYQDGPLYASGEIFTTQTPPIVTMDGPRPMYWGFPRRSGGVVINARSETVHTSPYFRDAFAARRCLVPASGFFEWRKTPGGKVKHMIRTGDSMLFMAGIYRPFTSLAEKGGHGYVILTTGAWSQMAPIHDRMPVILSGDGPQQWLDPGASQTTLFHLLDPGPVPLIIEPALQGG